MPYVRRNLHPTPKIIVPRTAETPWPSMHSARPIAKMRNHLLKLPELHVDVRLEEDPLAQLGVLVAVKLPDRHSHALTLQRVVALVKKILHFALAL